MANYLLTQTGEEVQDILNQAPDTEAGLQQEVTNREQADTAMQQAITAEATARADADATLDGKIDAETSRAEAAEGTLDDKIDQEVADRTEAVTAEATARQQADTSLQQAITAEATARVDADATLDGKIDAETTRAEAAEGTLTDAINKEVTDRTAAVAAEVTARQQADTSLQQAISTEAQARSAADTEILGNLQTESRTRLNADTDLQDHIDDEETRAKAAEATLQANIDALGQSGGAAVAAERERAEAAESTLDGKIDAETDRAEAAEGTLTDAIAQEVTDRTAAVSAEATARQQADTALQTAINGKQDTIADLADIRSGAAAGATAYQKPATGIPATDMSAGVQTSLDKADSALQEHQSLADYYTKSEVDNLITTPDQEYVSVTATAQTTAVTDLLPSTGAADTIYRVGNWDGTQYDPTMYALFAWNGTTYVCLAVRSFVGEVYDISVNHPDGQGNPTPYADLTAALGTDGANIPADIRRGGMSIKFIQGTVQSSDNKYVQCRYMSSSTAVADFTNVANWQGVDDEPTAGSENLVKSGGVAEAINNTKTIFKSDVDSDLSIADENGYVLAQFKDGNIKTKNFDSKKILKLFDGDTDADFSISDENGYVIVEFKDGSINTKSHINGDLNLNGKNVLFLGDSITYYKEYVNSFAAKTHCTPYNRGLGSSCISNGGTGLPASFCYRIDLESDNRQDGSGMTIGMPSESMDLVIIEGGINDFGYTNSGNKTANLGAIGIADSASVRESFYGAAKYVVNKMKTLYPNALVCVLGLIPTFSPVAFPNWSMVTISEPDNPLSTLEKKKTSENNSWYDYNEALKNVALQFGACFISLENMGMNPLIESDRVKYYKDGLHPNNAGGELIANRIINNIVQLNIF